MRVDAAADAGAGPAGRRQKRARCKHDRPVIWRVAKDLGWRMWPDTVDGEVESNHGALGGRVARAGCGQRGGPGRRPGGTDGRPHRWNEHAADVSTRRCRTSATATPT